MSNTAATTPATIIWTLPENLWGRTGEHRSCHADKLATVTRAKANRTGWLWTVTDVYGEQDATEGYAPTWQAARKAAEAALRAA